LECRTHDQTVLDLIQPLLHADTDACVRAERAFNAYLEGGCQVPIAGYATLKEGDISIEGRVGSVDGAVLLRAQQTGKIVDAEQLGIQLAKDLLDQGAGELLKTLYSN